MLGRSLDSSVLGGSPIFVSYEQGNGTRLSQIAKQLSVSRKEAA